MRTPAQMAENLVRVIEDDIPEDVIHASQLQAAYRREEDRLLGYLDLSDETVAKRLSAWRARHG